MEFEQAIELARNNPGSILTRNDRGTFVVRRPDGSVISSSSSILREERAEELNLQNQALQIERQGLLERLELVSEARDEMRDTNSELRKKVQNLQNKVARLKRKIDTVPSEIWDDLSAKEAAEKRQSILARAASGALSESQLRGVIDRGSKFGFTAEEIDILERQLGEQRRVPIESALVVHATTDGQ